MSMFHLIYGIWLFLSIRFCKVEVSSSCYPYKFFRQSDRRFEQKTDKFWKFSEIDDRWIEVKLPCDLIPCVNSEERLEQEHELDEKKMSLGVILPLRKRISLTKMSETSVWIIGESGCIYERFWNGLEWVIAPHDLPISQGHAVAVFIICQKILALSESGNLYQMHVQLGEISQPVWIEFTHTLNQITDTDPILIKSGVSSDDRKRGYFCTKKGTLVELAEIEPPRWINHGQPSGANVAAIADVASTREVVYTISSAGDLYEYNSKSKPSWKRHIWQEKKAQVSSLIPSKGFTLHGLSGDHSESLFLLTKEGTLVERRLHQRKWKWIVHGSPPHQNLTSITPSMRDDQSSETSISLFFTTSVGSVFEYQIPKQLGEAWISHHHPLHAKAARGKRGLPLQVGRILFALDDSRLAELHLSGLGGESAGPSLPQNFRRKTSSTTKYVWSILDAPESEGWNAEFCTEERGPRNCMTGIKDESKDSGITSSVTGRRKQSQEHHYYLSLGKVNELISSSEEYKYNLPDDWISKNFRLRLMFEGKSFFLVTSDGLIFEHVCIEDVWIWLKHDSSTAMNGIVGNYNGSLFMVDTFGSVLLREWSGNEIAWKNCTDMRKGRNVVVGGQPWDRLPGLARKRVTTEDSIFFVSKNGRLLQFMVYMRKFKWKDCKNPPNVKVASIVDQELFRENIIFVTGRNGRLYQYNKVNDLWHEHYQSQHLILSNFPGTVIRPMSKSLTGSIFMLSEDGGLVEYNWNTWNEWNWIEHGTPYKGVTLIGSPGPSFEGNQLLLIGSDGKVYLRYMEKNAWKWKDCGFPSLNDEGVKEDQENIGDLLIMKCDPKVASTRPVPFSGDSAIFELRDGRLAEIKLVEGKEWVWTRIIGTPNSLCIQNYWITVASSS
ncbi:uncharacterized protein LOC123917657 isoform X2 [Trifolium pratense]|uniref:uncharacterized protein LOC123917657 isoform X2 n=1 Tax=Trifolium pratense TaxID=57577 RepID=UPI001E69665B|nr:uncharacterized protein LOC123917657 isoform X2 [Trifolium pratense]